MTYSIDTFILNLFSHGYKVRTGSFYHLLKGKRTISVLSNAFLYDALPFFKLFPTLKEIDYQRIINRLLNDKFLVVYDEKVAITTKGMAYLKNNRKSVKCPDINNFKYAKNDASFFDMLLFATQVLAELSQENKEYQPIELNSFRQYQLKNWLAKRLQKTSKREFIKEFIGEWQALFTYLTETEELFLANHLSGNQQIGKTTFQIGDYLSYSSLESFLMYKQIVHKILDRITQQSDNYPLFFSLYDLIYQEGYNQSAKVTYQSYLVGKTIEQIAQDRRIKLSTVHEHLLEMALIDSTFPFEDWLSNSLLSELKGINDNFPIYREWKYNDIENEVSGELTYFEMRLYQLWKKRGELNEY